MRSTLKWSLVLYMWEYSIHLNSFSTMRRSVFVISVPRAHKTEWLLFLSALITLCVCFSFYFNRSVFFCHVSLCTVSHWACYGIQLFAKCLMVLCNAYLSWKFVLKLQKSYGVVEVWQRWYRCEFVKWSYFIV